MRFSPADVAYVNTNYFSLDDVCAGRAEDPEFVRRAIAERALPAPSYVLDGGVEMVPADYFVLVDQAGGPARLRDTFAARYLQAGGSPGELDESWDAYIAGIFGICLRVVLPETIVRKDQLVRSIDGLLADPQPADSTCSARLACEVWELDVLEREFSPDYDRSRRLGEPLSRDRCIKAARELYPEVCAVGR